MEKVVFIKDEKSDQSEFRSKIYKAIIFNNLFNFINKNDFVGIKTHFGETKNLGFVEPDYIKMLGEAVKESDGLPFITETSTLYKGNRSNSILHISLANEHGFSYENTGLPIIMADGLWGEDGIDVNINGKIFNSINAAMMIARCNALIVVTHFTGHLLAGFGGAIKNLGMGCVSRKGKLLQHSKSSPVINTTKCIRCHECIQFCPVSSIYSDEFFVKIDGAKCIGCGQCISVCKISAIEIDWDNSNIDFQKKLVEHAFGIYNLKKDKIIFINFLTNISRNCDCMRAYKQVVPNIGVLISIDPVAIDLASIKLIEEETGKKISEIMYKGVSDIQFEYARELGFGNQDYELIEYK